MTITVMTPKEFMDLRAAAKAKGKLQAFLGWQRDRKIIITRPDGRAANEPTK